MLWRQFCIIRASVSSCRAAWNASCISSFSSFRKLHSANFNVTRKWYGILRSAFVKALQCCYMWLRFLTIHEVTWYIISVVSVCMSVCPSLCLSDDNFRKPWRMKFIFAHPVVLYIQRIRAKFVYESHRVKVKVKVTGAKSALVSMSSIPRPRKYIMNVGTWLSLTDSVAAAAAAAAAGILQQDQVHWPPGVGCCSLSSVA